MGKDVGPGEFRKVVGLFWELVPLLSADGLKGFCRLLLAEFRQPAQFLNKPFKWCHKRMLSVEQCFLRNGPFEFSIFQEI